MFNDTDESSARLPTFLLLQALPHAMPVVTRMLNEFVHTGKQVLGQLRNGLPALP